MKEKYKFMIGILIFTIVSIGFISSQNYSGRFAYNNLDLLEGNYTYCNNYTFIEKDVNESELNVNSSDYWQTDEGLLENVENIIYSDISPSNIDNTGHNITADYFKGDGSELTGIETENNYVTDASFSGTDTKTLTLSREGLSDLTADFTDRYEENTDDQTLSWSSSNNEISIESGNTIDISDITGLGDSNIDDLSWNKLKDYPSACPDDTYVTEVGDSIECSGITDYWVDESGDSMTGGLGIGYSEPSGTDLHVDGDVGIGTDSPSEKLEVDGNINVEGSAFLGENLDMNNNNIVSVDDLIGNSVLLSDYLSITSGESNTEIHPDFIYFDDTTSDPTSVEGAMWYRSDLQEWKGRKDGSTVKFNTGDVSTDLTGGDGINPSSITDGDTLSVAWEDAGDLDSNGNINDWSGANDLDGSGNVNWENADDLDSSGTLTRDDWVDKSGDSMTGRLTIDKGADGSVLRLLGNNKDVDFHLGHNGESYGFYWRYKGTDSGNDNDLELWTQGETGSDNQVYNVKQNANIEFYQNLQVNGDIKSDDGVVTIRTG